jgi:hypothetical protein
MAARTVLYEVGGDGDIRAEMNGNTLCRPLPALLLTTGWTKLRLAWRVAMQDGAHIFGTPRLAFGLCSGTTNPFDNGAGLTTNFIGAITDQPMWNRVDNIYQLGAGPTSVRACTRVGTTLTLGAGLMTDPLFAQTQWTVNPAKRQPMFLDITKGSPNFTIKLFQPSADAFSSDVSLIDLKLQVIADTPTLSFLTLNNDPVEIAASESPGVFNAINVSWDRPTPFFYFSDFIVARLE